jgi:hypothetical protein
VLQPVDNSDVAELPLDREDVNAIMGSLFDLKLMVARIIAILDEDDEEEEEE